MSDNYSLIIKNGSCYIDGKLIKSDIGLYENKIKKIGNIEENNSKVYDATDKVVLPGIIDTQVHFREPGSTDAEDLESGSRAAVLGGVTSLFEMPNTNPPTANLVEFEKKLQAAKNRMHTNYAFYFGATPQNTEQLAQLKNVDGCCGVKLFAGSSTGNLLVDKEADIEKAGLLSLRAWAFARLGQDPAEESAGRSEGGQPHETPKSADQGARLDGGGDTLSHQHRFVVDKVGTPRAVEERMAAMDDLGVDPGHDEGRHPLTGSRVAGRGRHVRLARA